MDVWRVDSIENLVSDGFLAQESPLGGEALVFWCGHTRFKLRGLEQLQLSTCAASPVLLSVLLAVVYNVNKNA